MTDGIARRDRHVARWAESLRQRGVPFSSEALQRSIAEDLRVAERAKAEGLIGRKKKTKKAKRAGVARPDLHAEALAQKIGGEFFTRSIPTVQTAPVADVSKLRGVEAERHYAMQRRIKHLSQRGQGRIKADQTLEQGPWLYPTFAREIALTTIAYGACLGGYKDLNAEDRRRRFLRALEDICNRSDAAVGVGWWVKR